MMEATFSTLLITALCFDILLLQLWGYAYWYFHFFILRPHRRMQTSFPDSLKILCFIYGGWEMIHMPLEIFFMP